jgi:hypothetical protein
MEKSIERSYDYEKRARNTSLICCFCCWFWVAVFLILFFLIPRDPYIWVRSIYSQTDNEGDTAIFGKISLTVIVYLFPFVDYFPLGPFILNGFATYRTTIGFMSNGKTQISNYTGYQTLGKLFLLPAPARTRTRKPMTP